VSFLHFITFNLHPLRYFIQCGFIVHEINLIPNFRLLPQFLGQIMCAKDESSSTNYLNYDIFGDFGFLPFLQQFQNQPYP
jgi:hypothetical protein